ncbi:hypothetical protein EDB92DRAFT_2111966 [Lactarius akahatsu]|uniref:GS catalytic domain-containing protein n=1 Tax=Lactarius akahatsu TaxID=416441 RepID=A0AAD4LSS6_9AGAM|nr:hypothetical protein EDB92DRAFT_2111966 [Lactarius akahatsu]
MVILPSPDLSSIRLCGYAPGHETSLMGWFEEKFPIQKQGHRKGYTLSLCVEFLVGFETEFIVLKTTQPVGTENDATWSASCAFSPGSDAAKCLEEIANALQTGEIELLMYHSESAPGQYEVVTGPLQAVGAVAFSRETIAAKHGLRATFARRVYADSSMASLVPQIGWLNCSIIAGTAARPHISIHRTAQPPANPPPANPDINKDNDDTGTIVPAVSSREPSF